MNLRVAIVDDKTYLRQSLKERLDDSGHSTVVLLAENGADFLFQARNLDRKQLPEVVLMDIEMPVMNGIEAVSVAKELYPEMEFLMLTVFDDDEKIFEALKAGATGYLLKDESFEYIQQSIAALVKEGGSPLSPRIARKVLGMLGHKTEIHQKEKKEDTNLSARELEILEQIVKGLNYNQIADLLFISPHTVRKHIQNIYEKLHVTSKLAAVKVAMKKKLF